jgi:RNA polymerase primary sigma factor
MELDEIAKIINSLKARAKSQGYLTIDQINDMLPTASEVTDQIDDLILELSEDRIDILDKEPESSAPSSSRKTNKTQTSLKKSKPAPKKDGDTTDSDDTRPLTPSDAEEKATADRAFDGDDLDSSQLNTLELYLSEIGDYHPLPLEKELELGEQLERAEQALKERLICTPFAISQLHKITTRFFISKNPDDDPLSLNKNEKLIPKLKRIQILMEEIQQNIHECYQTNRHTIRRKKDAEQRYFEQVQSLILEHKEELYAIPLRKECVHRWVAGLENHIHHLDEMKALLQQEKRKRMTERYKRHIRWQTYRLKMTIPQVKDLLSDLHILNVRIQEAKTELINANLKLVVHIAKHSASYDTSFYDLIQEGNMGLVKAVDRYDYKRGYRFSTYATWWIRQMIHQYVVKNSKSIQIPSYVNNLINKLVRTTREMKNVLGKTPTNQQIAKRLNWPVSKVNLIRHIVQNPISLDAPVGESNEHALVDYVPSQGDEDPINLVNDSGLHELLEQCINELPERERDILALRFGFKDGHNYTIREIAQTLDINPKQVRYHNIRGLKLLRDSEGGKRLKAFLEE